MIHYHGADISGGQKEAGKFYKKRDVLISYARPNQIQVISEICRSFVLDNGAFSFWKSNLETDWNGFYEWIHEWKYHPRFEWFLCPDVIGGNEKENDELIEQCPMPKHITVPVYHIGENYNRLEKMLSHDYPRIAIGTTPGYGLRSIKFINEMRKIFEIVCNNEGVPQVKIHGLRMLDPEIVKAFPFSSCDSADAVIESVFDYKWTHRYFPKTKSGRAALVADYLEQTQSPSMYNFKPIQMELL